MHLILGILWLTICGQSTNYALCVSYQTIPYVWFLCLMAKNKRHFNSALRLLLEFTPESLHYFGAIVIHVYCTVIKVHLHKFYVACFLVSEAVEWLVAECCESAHHFWMSNVLSKDDDTALKSIVIRATTLTSGGDQKVSNKNKTTHYENATRKNATAVVRHLFGNVHRKWRSIRTISKNNCFWSMEWLCWPHHSKLVFIWRYAHTPTKDSRLCGKRSCSNDNIR